MSKNSGLEKSSSNSFKTGTENTNTPSGRRNKFKQIIRNDICPNEVSEAIKHLSGLARCYIALKNTYWENHVHNLINYLSDTLSQQPQHNQL